MKKSGGFSTLEILVAATLFSMIMGYAIPLVVRSVRDIARYGWNTAHIDAGLLAAVRLQEEINGAKTVSVISPAELEIQPALPDLPVKKIRWERGVIRIHRGNYIYPITAIGDAQSVQFEEYPLDQIQMHWDTMKLPLHQP